MLSPSLTDSRNGQATIAMDRPKTWSMDLLAGQSEAVPPTDREGAERSPGAVTREQLLKK